jgi:creatinine amidohydrolase
MTPAPAPVPVPAPAPAPSPAPSAARAPAPTVLRWEELSKTAFDRIDRSRAVVLVTCSPIEVHGPHLPLGTDAMEGEGLLARMVALAPPRHRDRVFLRLPPFWVGADVLPQVGSLHYRPETVIALLEDLGRTLGAQGFRHVIVSNFHGSPRHFIAIEEGCARGSRGGARMYALFSLLLRRLSVPGGGAAPSPFDALSEVAGIARELLRGDAHAGLVETAQMLALRPDLVEPGHESLPRRTVAGFERAAEGNGGGAPAPGRGTPLHSVGGVRGVGALLAEVKASARWFARESYAGAPGAASREAGEKILDYFGGKAAEALGEVLDGTLAPEDCRSPLFRARRVLLSPAASRILNGALGFRPLRS